MKMKKILTAALAAALLGGCAGDGNMGLLGGGFGAAGLAGEQAGGHQGQLAAFFGKQHYSSYPSIMIFHSPSRFRRRQGWLAQRHWQVGSRYGLLSGRPETVVPLW